MLDRFELDFDTTFNSDGVRLISEFPEIAIFGKPDFFSGKFDFFLNLGLIFQKNYPIHFPEGVRTEPTKLSWSAQFD